MSPLWDSKPCQILLVEDNPGDVRLAREALEDGTIPKNIHVAEDGVAAIEYLRGLDGVGDGSWPDIVLLDLNLPRKNGHEVLAEIRGDERLRQTPVIVFTSSAAEQDVQQAYNLHANCYVTKPGGFLELMETIKKIENFWLTTVTLPTRRPPQPGE